MKRVLVAVAALVLAGLSAGKASAITLIASGVVDTTGTTFDFLDTSPIVPVGNLFRLNIDGPATGEIDLTWALVKEIRLASDGSVLSHEEFPNVDRVFWPVPCCSAGGQFVLSMYSLDYFVNTIKPRTIVYYFGQFRSLSMDLTSPRPENFTLNLVSSGPEPAEWALMLVGFLAVGAALRRKSLRSQR
jgi:hypothetical protein